MGDGNWGVTGYDEAAAAADLMGVQLMAYRLPHQSILQPGRQGGAAALAAGNRTLIHHGITCIYPT